MNYCDSCGLELEKDDIALSKKLFGRQIKIFFCVECIAEYYKKTVAEMREMIHEFKKQGCGLFG